MKTDVMVFRLSESDRRAFCALTCRYGKPGVVLRELVIAYNEGRVKIIPPANKTEIFEDIYAN